MRFTGPAVIEDLSNLKDAELEKVLQKIDRIGEGSLIDHAEECRHLPDFYHKRINDRICIIYRIVDNEVHVIRVAHRVVIYKILTGKLRL